MWSHNKIHFDVIFSGDALPTDTTRLVPFRRFRKQTGNKQYGQRFFCLLLVDYHTECGRRQTANMSAPATVTGLPSFSSAKPQGCRTENHRIKKNELKVLWTEGASKSSEATHKSSNCLGKFLKRLHD